MLEGLGVVGSTQEHVVFAKYSSMDIIDECGVPVSNWVASSWITILSGPFGEGGVRAVSSFPFGLCGFWDVPGRQRFRINLQFSPKGGVNPSSSIRHQHV